MKTIIIKGKKFVAETPTVYREGISVKGERYLTLRQKFVSASLEIPRVFSRKRRVKKQSFVLFYTEFNEEYHDAIKKNLKDMLIIEESPNETIMVTVPEDEVVLEELLQTI